MTLMLTHALLHRMQAEAEDAYPDEGAGFLLGRDAPRRVVLEIRAAKNQGVDGATRNRFLISPEEFAEAEAEADRSHLLVIGVYHSHPDHAARPSGFDLEWAQPNFSYVITSVVNGKVSESRSWKLVEDRSRFEEENVEVENEDTP